MTPQETSLVRFNPFVEAAAGKYFVGRETQLNQFRLSLKGLKRKSPNHQYIAGIHGTGKTSYLGKLVEIATDEGFLGVMPTLDPKRLASEHISTIMRSIVGGQQEHMKKKDITQSVAILRDWDSGKNSTLFHHPRSEKLECDRVHQDFETLRNLMLEANVPGAVICVDEGQRIDPGALSALKNALQLLDCYLIVISLRLVEARGGAIAAGRTVLEEKAREAEGDFGASRFFVTGVPIGPFDTEHEAADCIKRRLENNAIQFDDKVVDHIGRITGRIPREMISLASAVYNRAAESQLSLVNLALLNEAFRGVHRPEVLEAWILVDKISDGARSALRGLIALQRPANAEEIASYLYPNATVESRSYIVAGTQGDLDRVCKLSSFCRKTDDSYEIADPIHAYALKLAFGME